MINYKKLQKKATTSLGIIYLLTTSSIAPPRLPLSDATEPTLCQTESKPTYYMISNTDEAQDLAAAVASIMNSTPYVSSNQTPRTRLP